ncbi:MAG TPA: hypothetical protein VFK16_06225 [Gemmatimonadaceae bacterium]|nr:hypothetical protein [Gemmatimonadaceae bacterium]
MILPPVEDTSTPLDRAKMVAEVMEYVVRLARATPLALPRPRVWIPLMTIAAFAFMLYSYAARPAWIWGPQIDRAAITAKKNADMRFAMFLLAQRIFEYRREFGVVPPSLAQVGDKIEGVTYVPLSDTTFSLRYEGRVPIILYSTQSMDGFLQDALQAVTAGKPK